MTHIHALAGVCLAGCESEVAEDIIKFCRSEGDADALVEVLPSSLLQTEAVATIHGKVLYRGDTGCGKLTVKTTVSPKRMIGMIRSVQYWFSFVAFSTQLDSSAIASKQHQSSSPACKELDLIATLVTQADWASALDTWTEYSGMDSGGPVSFCGRCVRSGNHAFNSQDVAEKIGDALLRLPRFSNWKVDLTSMDVEVIALVLNETILLGLHLPHPGQKPFLKCKLPTEVRTPTLPTQSLVSSGVVGTTVRPSTAYMILALLRARPYEVVVDATCSVGTALVEAAYGHKCLAVGGDSDERLNGLQRDNAASALEHSRGRCPAIVESLLWGANRLPLRDGFADMAVVEIPWSKRSSSTKIPKYCNRMKIPQVNTHAHTPTLLRRLHSAASPHLMSPSSPFPLCFFCVCPVSASFSDHQIVEEVARILCPSSGRVCFLLQAHQHLVSVLDSIYFCDTFVRGVNVGGFVCSLVTANRSPLVFVEPKKGTDTWDKHRLSWYDETKGTQQQPEPKRTRKE
jgi:hypothetical protein